jgi:hypothetical protein
MSASLANYMSLLKGQLDDLFRSDHKTVINA